MSEQRRHVAHEEALCVLLPLVSHQVLDGFAWLMPSLPVPFAVPVHTLLAAIAVGTYYYGRASPAHAKHRRWPHSANLQQQAKEGFRGISITHKGGHIMSWCVCREWECAARAARANQQRNSQELAACCCFCCCCTWTVCWCVSW